MNYVIKGFFLREDECTDGVDWINTCSRLRLSAAGDHAIFISGIAFFCDFTYI